MYDTGLSHPGAHQSFLSNTHLTQSNRDYLIMSNTKSIEIKQGFSAFVAGVSSPHRVHIFYFSD